MDDWTALSAQYVEQACRLEVLSPKPGNVSPKHQFAGTGVDDFLRSAEAIAKPLAMARRVGIGPAILSAVQQTQQSVGQNTNLGIILLLAPLSAVPPNESLADGIETVLNALTVDDAVLAYAAIALAEPGGLGHAGEQDIAFRPTEDLRTCMRLAADRDLVAAQYANGFHDVLNLGLPLLQSTREWSSHSDHRIGWVAVNLLAQFGDTLIERKCGPDTNQVARKMAVETLNADWPFSRAGSAAYQRLEDFLRADGNRRNPGTTADMIAAILFAALREHQSRCVDDRLQFVSSDHDE